MDDAQPRMILLDRDGVINLDSPDYIKHPDEWHPIEHALDAVALLQQHYLVAVCTNQSGVGRGLFDDSRLADIHAKMNAALQAAGGRSLPVFYCPHHPHDQCDCRKPKPGLLLTAMQSADCSPGQCVYVGDSEKDLLAAQQAGCEAVLVLTGNGPAARETPAGRAATCYGNLADFAEALIRAGA